MLVAMIRGVHHLGLQGPDPSAQLAPYAHALGVLPHGAGDEAWLAAPNGYLLARRGAAPVRVASVHATGLAHLCLQSRDAGAAARRLDEAPFTRLAEPVALGTGFHYGYARDPQGRLIELETAPFLHDEPPGWFAHVSFVTRQPPRLADFYAALTERPLSRGPRVRGVSLVDHIAQLPGIELTPTWLRGHNLTLEFMHYAAPALADPAERQTGWTHIAFEVDDADAAHARALALGATPADTQQLFGVTSPAVLDPEGNRLHFIAWPRGSSPTSLSALASPHLIEHVLPARAAYLGQPS